MPGLVLSVLPFALFKDFISVTKLLTNFVFFNTLQNFEYVLVDVWANDERVRDALHVRRVFIIYILGQHHRRFFKTRSLYKYLMLYAGNSHNMVHMQFFLAGCLIHI